VSLQWTTKLR